MPHYSAFTRFGHLAYSSKEPHGKVVYESILRALGPGYDTTSFDGNRITAEAYANAIEIANCLLCLERAVNQQYPLKATEMLPELERRYGVTPGPKATLPERRAAVAARMAIAKGPIYGNVVEVLQKLLGSDFVQYLKTEKADFVDLEPAGVEDRANFVKPGTPAKVYKLLQPAMPTGSAELVRVQQIAGDFTLQIGDKAVIDGFDENRRERITITDKLDALGAVYFESVRPHAAGAILTTQYFPIWRTTARVHTVVMSQTAATDRVKRRKTDEEMRRLMRGGALWYLTDGNGPFKVENGRIGVTPIEDI